MSKPGHNRRYECAQQGCGTQRWVYHDNDAGCWRVKGVGICEHNTRSAYMQGTALHLPLPMMPKLQVLPDGNCPERALALMREVFPRDALVNKMTARWITNWSQCRMPPPPSTKAALEKWINDLAPETKDGHDPYCFMHTIKEDGSCFVAGFTTPNLIRNARRGRGEDYLSIEGQFSTTVEGFTMQIVGTCDRALHLLPLAVCVATAERGEVVRPFLAALREEVEKDGMPWAPTKGMADHADAFRDELVAQFAAMEVAGCFFHVGKKVRDKAPLLGSFYKPVMARVCRVYQLPSATVHQQKKQDMLREWSTMGVSQQAVSDSHSYQLFTTLHLSTKIYAFSAAFALCPVSPKF